MNISTVFVDCVDRYGIPHRVESTTKLFGGVMSMARKKAGQDMRVIKAGVYCQAVPEPDWLVKKTISPRQREPEAKVSEEIVSKEYMTEVLGEAVF